MRVIFSTWALVLICVVTLQFYASDLVPSASGLEPRAPILIHSNDEFTLSNGVVGGDGTASSPYVIEGWDIETSSANGITIFYTDAYFIIRNLYAHSGLGESQGIVLVGVSNGLVANTAISDFEIGIVLTFSTSIAVLDNEISNSNEGAIIIQESTNITLSGNILTASGIVISGSLPQLSSHTITPDNVVNGKPLYYYKDCADLDLDGFPVGQLILVNCRNVRVANLRIAHTNIGVYMLFVDNARVTGNIISSTRQGLIFARSTNINITNNIVSDNKEGVLLVGSINATLTSNILANSRGGTRIPGHGLLVTGSTEMTVYHNDFINNLLQASDDNGKANSWDIGYPGGGNFWSDYTGVDDCGGPDQSICPSPDGIGDAPYPVDNDSTDRYPSMKPLDTSPPAWPAGSTLAASDLRPTSLTLAWTPAVDDTRVAAYLVYKKANITATLSGEANSYKIKGLVPGTRYTFKVEAGDDSDNWSNTGPSLTLTMPAEPSAAPTPNSPQIWQRYWYLVVAVATVAVALPILTIWVRGRRREQETESRTEVAPGLGNENCLCG